MKLRVVYLAHTLLLMLSHQLKVLLDSYRATNVPPPSSTLPENNHKICIISSVYFSSITRAARNEDPDLALHPQCHSIQARTKPRQTNRVAHGEEFTISCPRGRIASIMAWPRAAYAGGHTKSRESRYMDG